MQSPYSFLRLIGLGAVFVVVPFSVHAQDNGESDWNHFGLNFRAAFNIAARFSEPSSGGALPPGPGAGLALNHQYNDGYVNVDSSGNQGGQTWNWGYQHPSQINGGDVLMHADGGLAGASERNTDDPNLGLDFNYVRDIAHDSWGQWGIKFGIGYTPVVVRDHNPMSENAETITDRYPLNGVTAPLAPYSGSLSGPGPVLGSEPISRSIAETPNGAIIAGDHNLDAALFDLRLGPSFTIPLCTRFSVQTSGGLAVGLVHSHFTFNDTGPVYASGSNSRTGVVPGAYGEVGFAYRLCHASSLFTGVQFEYLADFNQSADGRSAHLDLGATIFYEFGLQFHF
jgi:hypothetical protein